MSIADLKSSLESATGLEIPEEYLGRRIELLLLIAAIANISGTNGSSGGISQQQTTAAVEAALKNAAKAATVTENPIASSITSVQLLAANTNRKFATLRNASTSTAYVSKSASATTDSVIELLPGGVVYFDDYTGAVSGIWVAANGAMEVAEGV